MGHILARQKELMPFVMGYWPSRLLPLDQLIAEYLEISKGGVSVHNAAKIENSLQNWTVFYASSRLRVRYPDPQELLGIAIDVFLTFTEYGTFEKALRLAAGQKESNKERYIKAILFQGRGSKLEQYWRQRKRHEAGGEKGRKRQTPVLIRDIFQYARRELINHTSLFEKYEHKGQTYWGLCCWDRGKHFSQREEITSPVSESIKEPGERIEDYLYSKYFEFERQAELEKRKIQEELHLQKLRGARPKYFPILVALFQTAQIPLKEEEIKMMLRRYFGKSPYLEMPLSTLPSKPLVDFQREEEEALLSRLSHEGKPGIVRQILQEGQLIRERVDSEEDALNSLPDEVGAGLDQFEEGGGVVQRAKELVRLLGIKKLEQLLSGEADQQVLKVLRRHLANYERAERRAIVKALLHLIYKEDSHA